METQVVEQPQRLVPVFDERTCECGCGLRFKCFPDSPQRFAGRDCEATQTEGGYSALAKRDLAAACRRKLRSANVAPPGLINAKQLADAIPCSLFTVYDWTKKGLIPFERESARKTFYRLEDVRAAIVEKDLGRRPSQTQPTAEDTDTDEDTELPEEALTQEDEALIDEVAKKLDRIDLDAGEKSAEIAHESDIEAELDTEEAESPADLRASLAQGLILRADRYRKAEKPEVEAALLWAALDVLGVPIEGVTQ